MAERPWAVVFQTADEKLHEMLIPGGFAFVVSNGGILVISEEAEAVRVISARPLPGGESQDADHGEGSEQDAGPDLGERGPDDGGFLQDPSDGQRRGDAGDADEGGALHEGADADDGYGNGCGAVDPDDYDACGHCIDCDAASFGRDPDPDAVSGSDERQAV